jgi:metal-responsive CopG/Arc/MetJ family transcriptional regulator
MTEYDAVVKTTISVPDDLYRQADQVAAEQGLNRSELYVQALRAMLNATEEDELTAAMNAALDENTEEDDDLTDWVQEAARRSSW